MAQEGFRAITITQRYFGTQPWAEDGPAFSVKTHAEDVAAFIRELGAGPVHVVTWSYSGQVAFSLAVDQPELVKSLFIFEPSYPTYVTEPSVLKSIRDDAAVTFGHYAKAAKENDGAEAVRQLINVVSGGGPGYFAAQPADAQSRQLDSAPAVLKMFKSTPLPISCEQLGIIKTPTALVWGSDTRPYFNLIANEAARCMSSATRITIPAGTHLWPGAEPAKFTATLSNFLKCQ